MRLVLIAGLLFAATLGAVALATGRPVPLPAVVATVVFVFVAAWVEYRKADVQPQADEQEPPMGEKMAPARGGGFEQAPGSLVALANRHNRDLIKQTVDLLLMERQLEILRRIVEDLGSDPCPRCGGCGLDPRWTDERGDYEPCDDCGGLGVVVH